LNGRNNLRVFKGTSSLVLFFLCPEKYAQFIY